MGTFTPNIGLYIPAAGETNYNDAFAQGMINLDQHDHTGGPNKGLPINSSGLADFSVTYNKLNANVVDPTTGIGVNSTPGLQNQLQILGILRNLFQLASSPGVGFVAMNGSTVAARTFQDTSTITWTNPTGLAGNPSADLVAPVPVSNGGLGVTSLTPYAPILGGTTPTGPVQQPAIGNAGDLLTSQGAGMPSVFTSPAALGQILYSKITLSAAQFTNIGVTPITIVAAPGAGKVLVPLNCFAYLASSGVAFINPNTLSNHVGIFYNGIQTAMIWSGNMFSGSTTNLYSWSIFSQTSLGTSAGFPTADIQNTPLQISIDTGVNYTGGGTSTVTFMLAYTIITLP